MGFYNLESLKEDARRHGIAVLNPDANLSREKCVITEGQGSRVKGQGEGSGSRVQGPGESQAGVSTLDSRLSTLGSFRLGLLNVKGMGEGAAARVVAEREKNGPYRSLADLVERAGLLREALENLAEAGALDAFGPDRRLLR